MRGSINKWLLWILVVLLPACAIAYSTWHVFRDAFPIIALLLVISVGVSAWTVVQADEPDSRLRQAGLAAKFALAVIGFLNLGAHVQIAREMSAAKESTQERHAEEDREQERRDREAKREAFRAEARAKELGAQKEAMTAEARLNNSLPVRQRKRTVAADMAASPTPDPLAPTSSPAPATAQKMTTAAATPEQVRDSWAWWVFFLTILESFVAVVGGAGLLVMRHWDADGNGVPDWIERLPESEIRRRFPREHARLYPQSQPATASAGQIGFAPPATGSNFTFPNPNSQPRQ